MAAVKFGRVRALAVSDDEEVTCFVSGRRVPKRDAVLVRIGPRHKVWMLPEYCDDEDVHDGPGVQRD